MKTVGEILKEARVSQNKTLEAFSQSTYIPLETLKAIEADNYEDLPPEIFVKGFIRNYAQELNLDPKKVLAVFRRDHQPLDLHLNKELKKPVDEGFTWSPKLSFIALSVSALLIVLGFFIIQARSYLFAPSLTVTSPYEGQTVKELSVEVAGKTIPDAVVYINDDLISTNLDGSFSYDLKLLSGENIIKIKAVNRRGKEKEIKLKVVVDKNS